MGEREGIARDYRRALAMALREGHTKVLPWLRVAVAATKDTGCRLTADEVGELFANHATYRAAQEMVFDLLGHYPGDDEEEQYDDD